MSELTTVKKLTPLIGAEILGVDLREVSEELASEILATFHENSVVFFRDQNLSRDQLKALGQALGKLHVHPLVEVRIPEHPEIVVIESDADTKRVAGEVWHSDASADSEPPLGSLLYMTVVPQNGGGDTLFASTAAAYDALSPAMKSFLDGLTAIHDGERLRGGYAIKNPNQRLIASEHPVIRTHPATKRRCIYVNRVYTSHIVGLKQAESDTILSFLYQHMEQPQFQCRFKWRPGSIAFWDNRCTLHHAVWDYYPDRRYAERVTLCGERPV